MKAREAFSLVEIVVVIAILGLLATGGILVLSGELRRAQRAAALDSFSDIHQRACRCCSDAVVRVVFDFDSKTVLFELPNGKQTLGLPALQQVVVRGAVLDRGKVSMEYSSGGPPGYAIMLAGKNSDQCLVVHAGTGIISRYSFEQVNASQVSSWQTIWANTN